MSGFSEPYVLKRNRNGGEVIVYIRQHIPSKMIEKHVFPHYMEDLFVELSFRKCKCLLLEHTIHKAFDTYTSYEKRFTYNISL